jgi:hypothetical protein
MARMMTMMPVKIALMKTCCMTMPIAWPPRASQQWHQATSPRRMPAREMPAPDSMG